MFDKQQLATCYQDIFGSSADLFAKSPGRINVIGEHTDYNEGFVLPAAIDKAVYVAVGKRDDTRIRIFAEDFNEYYEGDIREVAVDEKQWANYVLGVVNQFIERKYIIGGFNLYICGNIPAGSGLSSSAALECSCGFALSKLFGLNLDLIEIAKIGQLAEHTYVGVKCGIMDQFASALSKENTVIKLDCRSLEYEHVPLELGDYEILLLNTNVKHSLGDSAYNARREACEQGVAWIQERYPEVKSLRDADLNMLEKYVLPKDKNVFVKCKYVVEENERVLKSCEALKNGNIEELGRQLFAAHDAISAEYEVSCAELDYLVNFMKTKDEVVGARMMGGGFGGCTINLVRKGFSTQIVDEVSALYSKEFGFELTPIYTDITGGTQLL